MTPARGQDFFERARSVAASILFAAGAAAVIGSLLDWVTVETTPPRVPPEQAERLPPLSGLEVGDGWYVIVAAVVIIGSAFWLVLRGRGSWVAFAASIFIGAIAIADYRDIEGVLTDVEGIGSGPRPGLGLTLVVAAAMIGVIASVAGIAASPREPRAVEGSES